MADTRGRGQTRPTPSSSVMRIHGYAGALRTFPEYRLRVDMKDCIKINPEPGQVIRWENGKATHLKF